MATNKEIIVTQEGYDRLVEQLEKLKTVERKEIAEMSPSENVVEIIMRS